MRIAELAGRAGVKVSTVRFYERCGALPDARRSVNGYRTYDAEDVRRVRFLRRGQQLGFTLGELSEMAALSDRSRGKIALSGEIAERGRTKVAEIDGRIASLHRMRAALLHLLEAQCVDPNVPCPLVAAIAGSDEDPPSLAVT